MTRHVHIWLDAAAPDGSGEITNKHGEKYDVSYTNAIPVHYYTVRRKSGDFVGRAMLNRRSSSVENVKVEPQHQRKGIGSALYDHIESHLGHKLKPDIGWQTEAGGAFWKHRLGT